MNDSNTANCATLWNQEAVFPSVASNGSEFTDEILHQMEIRNWPPRDIFGAQMAIVEAVTNAMMHGNKYDPLKMVTVVAQVSPELVHLEVLDQGVGFDVNSIPDPRDEANMDCPSGRGVFLIHAFMTNVWFNDAGNKIFMEKVRTEDE